MRTTLIALCLCLPSLALAQDLNITHPDNYQTLPSRFASAPFRVAPHRIVTAPAGSPFRPLAIPTFRDVLRIGHQASYGTDNVWRQPEWGPTRQERGAIRDRLSDDAFLYLNLSVLHRKRALLIDANMKFEKDTETGVEYFASEYGYMPRFHVGILAHSLLDDSTYLHYFCKRPEDCLPGRNRTPNEQAINQVVSFIDNWGGDPRNRFQVRAKYHDFLAKHLPTLVKWSASLSNEAYVVGQATLENYDFATGSFPMEILLPQGTDNYARSLYYYEPADTKYRVVVEGHGKGPVMGPVSVRVNARLAPEAAEKLLEELKRDYGRQLPYVFVVLHVRILGLNSDFPEYGSGIKYYYDLLSPTVSLFKDDGLTQAIVDVRLPTR